MYSALKAGRPRTSKRLGKAGAGPSGGRLVAIDRQRHDAGVRHRDQFIDQRLCCLGRGRAKYADAQADRRQSIRLRGAKAIVERYYHLVHSAAPVPPMRGIDDGVGVAGTALGHTTAESVGDLSKLFRRSNQSATPVEEVQKLGEIRELQQGVAGARHRLPRGGSESLDKSDVETAFDMQVNLCLW